MGWANRGAIRLGALPLVAMLSWSGCGLTTPAMKATVDGRPSAEQLAQLFVDVDPATRELFHGIGGPELAPEPRGRYELIRKDDRGFSTTFDVRGPSGMEWAVKIGPEAQTEVVASRIVWAVGYHEPPNYYLPSWQLVGPDGKVQRESEARFRPKIKRLDSKGTWSWFQNPFVGTPEYRGLLVLMMMLNSTDLKDDNNTQYAVEPAWDGAARWFVVKDLGATFGETGRLYPRRNWVDGFERSPFISGVRDGRVQFAFRGRRRELLRDIRPADVRWMSERLARLTDAQWAAAFKAGGYAEVHAQRFIATLKQRVAAGRTLPDDGETR